MLNEISGDAVMFLMNALYFKGDWSYQFDEDLTSDRPFHTDGSNSVNVSTMKGDVGSKVTSGSNYMAIELPYGCTNFTMVVVVPGGTLSDFVTTLTAEKWNTITSAFDDQEKFGHAAVAPKTPVEAEPEKNGNPDHRNDQTDLKGVCQVGNGNPGVKAQY